MIPQRVKLKGFLCYKDEQEVTFGGSALWMLAGTNGSGKSSVFDAVTYALFGHHRGGSRDAHELINKDAASLLVEFDFSLDGTEYRVKRTLQRSASGSAKGTQQILQRGADLLDGLGAYQPLEGTNRKAEFDAWIRDHIGLDYDTFTSSVLLLQGKAEKLLDSTAKGRFEVLAGVVDLERYKRLHGKADDHRKALDGKLKGFKDRLAALPEVAPLELVEADHRIQTAEEARQRGQAEVERYQALEIQAKQWGELQTRLGGARQRCRAAEQLVTDAPVIEKDLARFRELRAVLPFVETVSNQQRDLQLSENKTRELLEQKVKGEEQRVQQDLALAQAQKKRDALRTGIEKDERRHAELSAQLLEATSRLEKLKEYERHQGELAKLQADQKRLPERPDEALQRAREDLEQLGTLSQVVPGLTRLRAQRDELRQARERDQAATQARDEVEARGKQLAAAVEQATPKVEEAGRVRQRADDEATRARTLYDQAAEQLRELRELHGAKVCRHCGQELTPGHLQEEERRRRQEAAAAEKRLHQAVAAQKASAEQEQKLRLQLAEVEKKRLDARDEYREHKGQADQARNDLKRLQRDCAQTYAELPDPFRARVSPVAPADWAATTYPTAEEVTALRQQAGGLAAARQALRAAEEVVQQWTSLRGLEAKARQDLARLQADLPADPQSVRREHVRLESESQALGKNLKVRRGEAQLTQQEIDRAARDVEQTRHQLTVLDGHLQTEEKARKVYGETKAQALRKLPPAWREPAEHAGLACLYQWQNELKELEAQKMEERGRQLEQARAGVEVLRQEVEDLDHQEQQFPAEAKQAPRHFQELLLKARADLKALDEDLTRARAHLAQLDHQQKQRAQVGEELLQGERDANHAKLAAELLGREKLQLYLVRQAERQVVDYANLVLDRLSGGQLHLRLCGSAEGEAGKDKEKALDLEAYNRVTGEKPINVAFLSGSQKFRVAVSLALGIGQYASRQHRPIESVIIDEGFGCLDKEGRQAMIQELQNLRGQLRCILLVSHQDEIAEAFADGYRFELANGATRVTRFQR